MKVSVIGGGGRVGSNTLFALQCSGIIKELVAVDVAAPDLASGEALDLRHGVALAGAQKIWAGDYSAAANSDVVVITAGLRRKLDESRLELINRNVSMFRTIMKEARAGGAFSPNTVVMVVSNPVDILTYIAVEEAGLPAQQVIGTGTMLDTTRFRSLLAEHFHVAAPDVQALILGEHGDSMVPILSTASINGTPMKSFPGYEESGVRAIFETTKKAGAEVIRMKGGAGWAIALATRAVVEAILLDTDRVMPVSSLQDGLWDLKNLCISVPTRVRRSGAVERIPIHISAEERQEIVASAEVLSKTLADVKSAN